MTAGMGAVFATLSGQVADPIRVDLRVDTDTCPRCGRVLLIHGLDDVSVRDLVQVVDHRCGRPPAGTPYDNPSSAFFASPSAARSLLADGVWTTEVTE